MRASSTVAELPFCRPRRLYHPWKKADELERDAEMRTLVKCELIFAGLLCAVLLVL
jgi:hypothetical protein